jgi:hypothetical protein
MDRLPPELISNIIDHLAIYKSYSSSKTGRSDTAHRERSKDGSLVPYACISRTWQYLIEHRTFASIGISHHELDVFQLMFGNARRRSALRYLHYYIVLPAYFEAPGKQHTDAEASAAVALKRDVVFTHATRGLFEALARWQGEDVHRRARPIALCLEPYAQEEDLRAVRMYDRYLLQARETADGDPELREADIVAPLPMVERIKTVQVARDTLLHPTALSWILAAIPEVEALCLETKEIRNKKKQLKQDYRCGECVSILARIMRLTIQASLERFQHRPSTPSKS